MLMMKLRAVQQGAGDDVVAGYEPEGDMVEAKYEAGASTYGKASIRNKRDLDMVSNPDPEERRKQKMLKNEKAYAKKGKRRTPKRIVV